MDLHDAFIGAQRERNGMGQDVILDSDLNQAFSREGQSDWMRSLKLLARAQALAWHAIPILERRKWLDLAQAEQETIDARKAERVLVHEQQ